MGEMMARDEFDDHADELIAKTQSPDVQVHHAVAVTLRWEVAEAFTRAKKFYREKLRKAGGDAALIKAVFGA